MNWITPFQSTLGGALIGAAASAKLALTGRILGISGTAKGLVRGDHEAWRLSFLGGLATGGLAFTTLYTPVFNPLSYSYVRAASSGFLVGVGSSLGNGCTSGHGICGNARFSIRSFVYTCVFMLSGMVTATVAKTAEVLGVVETVGVMLPSPSFMLSAAIFAILALLSLTIPAWISPRQKGSEKEVVKKQGWLDWLSEFLCGGVFAAGLCLSGMNQPTKVAAFLSPLSNAFDPSLLCVMGGALLVATPAFHWILNKGDIKKKTPVCTESFQVPTKKTIDLKLITGGVLFGAGWGLGGLCPGPALVSLVRPTSKLAIHCIFLFIGFATDLLFGKYLFPS